MLFYHEMEEKGWKAFLPTYLDERQQNKTFSFQHFNQLEHRRCWKFASEIQLPPLFSKDMLLYNVTNITTMKEVANLKLL